MGSKTSKAGKRAATAPKAAGKQIPAAETKQDAAAKGAAASNALANPAIPANDSKAPDAPAKTAPAEAANAAAAEPVAPVAAAEAANTAAAAVVAAAEPVNMPAPDAASTAAPDVANTAALDAAAPTTTDAEEAVNNAAGAAPAAPARPSPPDTPLHAAIADLVAIFNTPRQSDLVFARLDAITENPGPDVTAVVANDRANASRNRYTNIWPYDGARVKLRTGDFNENSDYVNASYMSVEGCPYKTISTQGPTLGTAGLFWQMVYDEEAPVVVMLTREVENGMNKCAHYWPDDAQAIKYGPVIVQAGPVEDEGTHIRRWFTLYWDVEGETRPARSVLHLQYIAWPDHGIPASADNFVLILKEAVDAADDRRHPIVVHCSAGCGRSGVFITVDQCTYLLKHADKALYKDDVVEYAVSSYRRQRVGMVQTAAQLRFVYMALATQHGYAVVDGKLEYVGEATA